LLSNKQFFGGARDLRVCHQRGKDNIRFISGTGKALRLMRSSARSSISAHATHKSISVIAEWTKVNARHHECRP
jgi:hypothetical protein